jgi:hypothetical protein
MFNHKLMAMGFYIHNIHKEGDTELEELFQFCASKFNSILYHRIIKQNNELFEMYYYCCPIIM